MDYSGAQIEVHGRCRSACTLITGAIPKDRLCFAEGAFLGFHWARVGTWDGPLDPAGTQWLIDHYPADIRGWLKEQGGIEKLPQFGYWVLPASILWQMGYRRCT